MKTDTIKTIIHDTIYTNGEYPHDGNRYVLAANSILFKIGVFDIDIICSFAKIIYEHATYDHEIANDDLEKIIKLLKELLKTSGKMD